MDRNIEKKIISGAVHLSYGTFTGHIVAQY